MSKQRALTDEQVAFVVNVTARRRLAAEALRKFPTNADIAGQLGCCQRLIDRISAGHLYKTKRAVRLHDVMVELGIETP